MQYFCTYLHIFLYITYTSYIEWEETLRENLLFFFKFGMKANIVLINDVCVQNYLSCFSATANRSASGSLANTTEAPSLSASANDNVCGKENKKKKA